MVPLALLLGDPARLAFPGHLRLVRQLPAAGLAVAARVGVAAADEAALVLAYRAARALERAISDGLPEQAADRHALLHALWQAVAEVPADALGPTEGADLNVLAVAADEDGIGVAGVGLAAVWARGPAGLAPLVAPGHPLLGPPGRPSQTPGVLTLERGALAPMVAAGTAGAAVIAAPAHLPPALPPPGEVDRRCGLRP